METILRRFQKRPSVPKRRWKLSPMDLKSRDMWVAHSRAKDECPLQARARGALLHGESDDRRRGRLNCISNMLDPIDYEDVLPDPIELPPPERADYRRPPRGARTPIVGK